jgi:hypothetical protein
MSAKIPPSNQTEVCMSLSNISIGKETLAIFDAMIHFAGVPANTALSSNSVSPAPCGGSLGDVISTKMGTYENHPVTDLSNISTSSMASRCSAETNQCAASQMLPMATLSRPGL